MFKYENANTEQKQAIESIDGPLLIIAGPGTGKTFTLINRTLNLIINHKVKPSEILLATFTEKAANELKTRLSNELNKHSVNVNINDMFIGTFHSICLKILEDNLNYTSIDKNYDIFDSFDQQYFIYKNYNFFKKIQNFDDYLSSGTIWDKCETIAKYINRLNEELIDFNILISSNDKTDIFFGNILKVYNNLREKNNFLDFSFIQVETYKLLLNNNLILEKIKHQIKYIMIDEYQDTNHIQEKITFMLDNDNICVVGDDDQAIYRFRGATVRNILEFPSHFKTISKVTLVKNYRSNKQIIDFYNKWISTTKGRTFEFEWNNYRYNKLILSEKKDTSNSNSVIQISTNEQNYLNNKIISFINELKNQKIINDYNQIAFLFRSVKNPDVIALAEELEKNDIFVYSPRSNMFFSREEIKISIGYLLYCFPRYLNYLGSPDGQLVKLRKYYLECINLSQKYIKDDIDLMGFLKTISREHTFLENNLKYCFSGLMYKLLRYKPLNGYMNIDFDSGIQDSRPCRNIGIFLNLLIKFESLNKVSIFTIKNIDRLVKTFFNTYLKFLVEGGITEYEDNEEYAPSGCISFLTIHQSKGLEFPIVFVGSQSSIPRKQYNEYVEDIISKYSGRGDFEPLNLIKYFDFWRLFYVAFSRAQSLLIMIADKAKNNEPSKYFEYFYEYLPIDTDINTFKLEKINISNLKHSYSFTSDINVYNTCPLQYFFFNELNYGQVKSGAALFGTIVHETIEDINKNIINKHYDLINDVQIKEWFDKNYNSASKLNNFFLNEGQLNRALEQVIQYKEKVLNHFDYIKESELPISITNSDYNINGVVDLIICKNNEYEIVDFKTEKKPDIFKDTDKIDRVRSQLEIYAYLVEKRYNIRISNMKVYYTSELGSNPIITFKRDDKHVYKTIDLFDKIVKRIQRKEFNYKCNDSKICKNCDLRYYCKKG